MKRPAFQFYVESWMANAKLRRCSWSARGVWAAVLCTMHDSDEYGVLRWPLAEIAQSIGCPTKLLRELVDKGVLKGSDTQHDGYIYRPRHGGKEGPPVTLIEPGEGPCWYSSRMVKDEYRRLKAGGETRYISPNSSENRQRKSGPAKAVDNSGKVLPDNELMSTNPPAGLPTKPPPDPPPGHGAIALDSISINIGVDGDINAGPREPHPLGERSPEKAKVNGKAKPPAGWHTSDEGIDKAGRMLGMQAKRGEDYGSYKARIFAELRGHR